jgi:plasmid stabilization system protein ParE
MRVAFEPGARDDLDRIFAWIAKDNPRAATEMIARIEAKVMQLATPELTHMGRPGFVQGTRELLESPYIVVYRVDHAREEVVVVSIVHGARDRDDQQQTDG